MSDGEAHHQANAVGQQNYHLHGYSEHSICSFL